jgi:hypothetical protein
MDTYVLENQVLKISNGDLEALEGLYRDYRHAVFAYSLHLLRDRSQAEDNTTMSFCRSGQGFNVQNWIQSRCLDHAHDPQHGH